MKKASLLKINFFIALAVVLVIVLVRISGTLTTDQIAQASTTSVATSPPVDTTVATTQILLNDSKSPFNNSFKGDFGIANDKRRHLLQSFEEKKITNEVVILYFQDNIYPLLNRFVSKNDFNEKNLMNITCYSGDIRLGLLAFNYFNSQNDDDLKKLLVADKLTQQNFVNLSIDQIKLAINNYFAGEQKSLTIAKK
jgi:hypothetical protein